MARRRTPIAPPPSAQEAAIAAWRYRSLRRWLMLTADDAVVVAAVLDDVDQAHDDTIARVVAVETYIDELGRREAADRFVSHLADGRSRWRGASSRRPA